MRAHLLAALLAILSVVWEPHGADAIDVTGKWRFQFAVGPPVITQVTQSGSTLSFTLGAFAFSGSLSAAGTFTDYDVSASSPELAEMGGRIMPSGNLLDGRLVPRAFMPGFLPTVAGVVATRCTCDDGNTSSGDGCDATCQVEPCWTCAGDPSVCSPASDGSACEDGSVCTTGETCSAGVCAGGTPVSRCVDMTGLWNRHTEIPNLSMTSDTATDVIQRGTDLIVDRYVGTIDPATGAFDLRAANLSFFCFTFDPLLGSVAPGGATYAASGSVSVPNEFTPDHCDTFALTETGTRCVPGRRAGRPTGAHRPPRCPPRRAGR